MVVLNTRYKDFYDYYCSVKSNSEVIENLKSNISGSISEVTKKTSDIDWSDMELGLGAYTKYLSTEEEVDSIYEDLRHNLRTYINQEKKRIDDKNDFNVEALIKDLKMPERFLPGELVDDGPHQFNKENALRKEIMKKMGLTKVEEASYRAKIYIDIMKREDHIFNIGSV